MSAELEQLRARVKELEALLGQRCDGIDCDRGDECVSLHRQLTDANADRARLRACLTEANGALCSDTCGRTHTHGCKECRAALDSSDASEWLRERERRVAERVRESCVNLVRNSFVVSTSTAHERVTLGSLRSLDIDALLENDP